MSKRSDQDRAQLQADIARLERETGISKDPPPKSVMVDGKKIPVATRPDPGRRS